MRHIITQAGELIRATVWTPHGTSSKTFRTAHEAVAWVAVARNRKPMGKA